ncbi:hypothetical protein ACEQ8H_005905 [Pleosporales sp. CAS-2024a]
MAPSLVPSLAFSFRIATRHPDEARQGVLSPFVGPMARSMRLLLIRHGETVDNVAGLYAGVRDSELTNHGYQQATRLGLHFKQMGLLFTHLFSSHLQRAAKTAGKIREAQMTPDGHDAGVPEVAQVPLLVEQNFGSMEGKKWYQRPADAQLTGEEHHDLESPSTTGFVHVESKDAMARRADAFLDSHLLPLLDETSGATDKCVAIVSHGIFLSTLWKRLLLRLPSKSVVLSSELQAIGRPSLEHLGGWSNTGYLELDMIRTITEEDGAPAAERPSLRPNSSLLAAEMPGPNQTVGTVDVPQASDDLRIADKVVTIPATAAKAKSKPCWPRVAHGWATTILAINGKNHLKGLKRTGGGVGSSRHDASQKSIETFFKRRKID